MPRGRTAGSILFLCCNFIYHNKFIYLSIQLSIHLPFPSEQRHSCINGISSVTCDEYVRRDLYLKSDVLMSHQYRGATTR